MLSWYANTFEISEGNITLTGLRRTRVLAWLTLIIVPLEILSWGWIDAALPPVLETLSGLIIFVSLMAFIALLFNPLVHRFWARDKYLDEWEIDVKRQAMSAGYKVLFGILFLSVIYFSFTLEFRDGIKQGVSLERVDSLVFTLLLFTFCVQVLTQLHLIRPIDGDEIEVSGPSRSPVWPRVAVVFLILMLFFGPAFFQGMWQGLSGA